MSYVYLALLSLAFIQMQCMVGGTRLLYSLPAYGLLALAATLTLTSIRRIRSAANLSCLLATTLCFSYLLIRSSSSPVDYLAWPDFYSIMGCLMAYLLVSIHLTKPTDRIGFVMVLLAMAVVQVFIGLIQFSGSGNFMLFGFAKGADRMASGMFISHNHFAGYLEAVGVMALSIAIWGRTKFWVRLLVGYGAAVCYLGVAIAGSRGGYLGTLCSLVVFGILGFFAAGRIGRSTRILGSILVAVLLGVAVMVGMRMMSSSSLLDWRIQALTTDDIRTHLWQAAWNQFRQSPAIGTGSGTYFYYGRLFRHPSVQSDPVHVHNDYLELLAEYGIVGVLGILLFFGVHIWNGVRAIFQMGRRLSLSGQSQSNSMALQMGALAAMAAYLVHSLTDFNFHIPVNALMFATFFGMLANPFPASDLPKPGGWKLDRLLPLSLPCIGFWLFISGTVETIGHWRCSTWLTIPVAWRATAVLPHMAGEYHAENARRALRDEEYARVIEISKLGLCSESRNPRLYFYLGEANRAIAIRMRHIRNSKMEMAYFEEAVKAYQGGLAWFPNDENLLLRLAQALDGLGRLDEAETAYLQALQCDPNLGVLHAFYGAHLKKAGRLEESESQYRIGRELADTNVSQLGKAEVGIP